MNEKLDDIHKHIRENQAQTKIRMQEVRKILDANKSRIEELKKSLNEATCTSEGTPGLVEQMATTPPTFNWIINCVGAGVAIGLLIAIGNAIFFGG